jgi:hypothetical protein
LVVRRNTANSTTTAAITSCSQQQPLSTESRSGRAELTSERKMERPREVSRDGHGEHAASRLVEK